MNSADKREHECDDVSYFYKIVMPAVDALELETLTKLHNATTTTWRGGQLLAKQTFGRTRTSQKAQKPLRRAERHG
jgi:hypothetical protein